MASGHRLFSVILTVAALLRLTTMLGYRPGRLYYGDSYSYLLSADAVRPNEVFDPSGYAFLLLLPMRPFHSVALVVAVQHLLGLATGLLVYVTLRHRGLPAWGATLATIPPLFDASFLQLENAVLADSLFIFLVTAAVAALTWSPTPSARAGIGASLLLAFASLTRTVGLPLLVFALAYLALRRVGRRALLVATVYAGLPLLGYASWYGHTYGRFAIVGGAGVPLWARTMTFADCKVIKPPAEEVALCPSGERFDAAEEYVWAATSPVNRIPGGFVAASDPARSFALHAIVAQPFDYIHDVAGDVSLTFHWTPARHPERVTPAFGFTSGSWPPPDRPEAKRAVSGYDPDLTPYHSVEPYAGLLRSYQYPAYLRGPFLAAILLLGALGLRRGTLLPWGIAVGLLVLPVAMLDFDHRYVLPVVPIACLAAALAMTGTGGGPAAGPPAAPVRRRIFSGGGRRRGGRPSRPA